jgi:CubicO group peptidase (beta-lactamase class C family)
MDFVVNKMSKLVFILILVWVSNAAGGQQINPSFEKLDKLFSHHLSHIQSPGFAVAVVKDGQVIFKNGYGLSSRDGVKPFTADTIIGIGSIAKSFTAMMILQLQEQGLLNIDDPIVTYLPWFRAADKAKSDKITIRMFLNMTSGLEARFSQLTLNQSKQADALEKGVRNLSSYQINGEPGQSFQYINEGWNTLGLIIEKLTGKSWEQTLANQVLTPLEMNRTSSDRKVLEHWQLAYGHYSGIAPIPADFIHMQSSLPAGSGFYSNATDLANYMKSLLNKGEYKNSRVLKQDSVDLLWKPAVSMSLLPLELGGSAELASYAMGWMRMEIDEIDYVFHGGEFRVSSSLLVLDPGNHSGIAILYNTGSLEPYSNESNIYLANNALRILRGLPVSSFGVPIQEDPTLNDFVDILSDQQKEKYIGSYLSKSGKRIDLLAGNKQGLQLNLMESIYPASFTIDFVNPSNFIARSIAHSYKGHFIENDNKSIIALKLLGETFRKRNLKQSHVRQYDLSQHGLQFILPKQWDVTVNADGFIARDPELTDAQFIAMKSELSYEKWLANIEQQNPHQNIIEMTEFKNGLFFQNLVFTDAQGSKNLALYCTYRNKTYIFKLNSSAQHITHLAMGVVTPFIDSLNISGK